MHLRSLASSALAAAVALFAFAPAAAATPTTAPQLTATAQVSAAPAAPPSGVVRYAGETRYETAVAASKLFAPGVPVVFVAGGQGFPDALSAAAAAAHLGGPLLLTRQGELPAGVAAELDRLDPQSIIVVGGSPLVGDAVVGQLGAYSGQVERIAGANRYETSLALFERAFDNTTAAYVASGRAFPDALAATGAAGTLGGPVVLVDGLANAMPEAAAGALKAHGVSNVFVAGGTGSVSAGIASSLTASGFAVDRRGGADRYETAIAVNRGFEGRSVPAVFLASGADFPDALAGAAIAGGLGAPLYLTRQACVPSAVGGAVRSLTAPSRVVMGGASVVSDAAAQLTVCAPPTTPEPPAGPVTPINDGQCPDHAPIKGNKDSMIYHMPGDRHYNVTKAEECFATAAAAEAAGYRRAKV